MNASVGSVCTRWKVRIFVGFIALTSLQTAVHAAAVVKVQPIQICKDDGSDCADPAKKLFLAETAKIWKQAEITIEFLDWTSTNSTKFRRIDNQAEVTDLFSTAPGAAGAAKTISMWFVDNHFAAWGEVNDIGGNKVIIDDGIFAIGRRDTVAHEIGHLLGLQHDDPGVEADFLMRVGSSRTIPGSVGNINPDGTMLDKLTRGQTTTAVGNSKVQSIPEPGTLVWMSAGVGLTLIRRARRIATNV